jgi:hypothetical protein
MSATSGRLRRAREWLWRGEELKALKERPPAGNDPRTLDESKACHTLARRVLAGIEPIPATTRGAVARALILAGISKCLAPSSPPGARLTGLFDDPIWQERLSQAGLDQAQQAAVQRWLQDEPEPERQGGHADLALFAFGVVLDTQLADRKAMARVLWRRAWLVATAFIMLSAVVALVVMVAAPPKGPDLAVGKPWQASSMYTGFPGSGVKQKDPSETAFFSTNDELNPWWRVDLGSSTKVGSVVVENRADCCPDRAIPLVVELSQNGENWREVARRTTSFRRWAPTFAPTSARYVRLRALRRTFLHFKDVRVHAPR